MLPQREGPVRLTDKETIHRFVSEYWISTTNYQVSPPLYTAQADVARFQSVGSFMVSQREMVLRKKEAGRTLQFH